MTSCKRPMFLTAAALAVGLLATPSPATALEVVVIDSGPNIKTLLNRDASPNLPPLPPTPPNTAAGSWWFPINFFFPITMSAASDGVLNVSAAGDINNLPTTLTPGGDRILVTTGGHFGTELGNLNFPKLNPDGTVLNCNAGHGGNPGDCPVFESVTPGSSPDPKFILLGHRGASLSNAGTAGLIVPKDLLQVGGTNLVSGNLVVSLFPFPFDPGDTQGMERLLQGLAGCGSIACRFRTPLCPSLKPTQ